VLVAPDDLHQHEVVLLRHSHCQPLEVRQRPLQA
jgi:hypothetical protein